MIEMCTRCEMKPNLHHFFRNIGNVGGKTGRMKERCVESLHPMKPITYRLLRVMKLSLVLAFSRKCSAGAFDETKENGSLRRGEHFNCHCQEEEKS